MVKCYTGLVDFNGIAQAKLAMLSFLYYGEIVKNSSG